MRGMGMPVAPLSGAVGVVAASAAGLDLIGAAGGLLAGVTAVVGLVISVAVGNAKRRRLYEQDMRDAERTGEERYRADMEFWRGIAVTLLQTNGHVVPLSPSQRPQPRRD